MAKDLYQEITDRIVAELEKGIIPWHRPWIGSNWAISHATGKPYSLLNQLILGRPGEYLTFKQVQDEGGKIKKGEKASMVVFWKWLEVEDEKTGEKKEIPYLRYINVFHIDQTEGVKAKHTGNDYPNSADADETADAIINDYLERFGVKLSHEEGARAYYQPSADRVVLPLRKQFAETAEYYSTAFHELAHSTGHESRLNRLTQTAAFGSDEYSKEELVAEISAATLTNHVGLETTGSFQNSAAYVQSWLKALKNDKRMIVSAAGRAEKAVALILNN